MPIALVLHRNPSNRLRMTRVKNDVLYRVLRRQLFWRGTLQKVQRSYGLSVLRMLNSTGGLFAFK